MTLTLRLFVNNERVSTAIQTKEGAILQVYPTKEEFFSEDDWRRSWKHKYQPEFHVETGVVKAKTKAPDARPFVCEEWECEEKRSFTAPAGTYYIGDICYPLSKDIYKKVFGEMGDYRYGLYTNTKTNEFFLVGNTADGDGTYRSNDCKEFPVDAGVIGILPVSLIHEDSSGGHIYTFTEPVKCKFAGGIFRFSSGDRSIVINTSCEDDDEDFESDDDDDEEETTPYGW